jgi:SWI/SNF-related matrix-associated actin-dependent regulator 1 of chromatin subfamily A
MHRFLPRLPTVAATGTRQQRIEKYLNPWDILVTGFQMFLRDHELIEHFPINTLVVDDVDSIRNPANQSAYAIRRLARRADRVAVLTGTPLQKRLHELYYVLELLDGREVFGSPTAFRMRYVRDELVSVYNVHAGRKVKTRQIVGYKALDEFKERIAPFALRRTPNDIDDVDLPAIAPPNDVYLDLYPAQAERYAELRKGVLKIIRAEGSTVKRAKAAAQFVYGAKICAGLATLGEPDGPGTSVKLDWIENILVDGDLSDEKVVVFAHFTDAVEALAKRLANAGVGHEIIWGRDTNKNNRARAQARFWDDDTCRVLIGTDAIEQSLNLQVSRHLINMDQLMNPARMQQLAGRIRRDGSAYRTVYIHNLLTRGTQEESYLEVLAREQALADHIWNESNQLYEALTPLAMLQLVGRSSTR